MAKDRYHYRFIHNVLGDFFGECVDHFGGYLHNRFKYKVVSTYDKAVEFLNKEEQYDRETDMPNLPAFILDPVGEMNIADANTGGKQLYRFPNLAPGFIKRWYAPIYQDADVLINVGFTRLKGEMNLIMLLNSFYEYCDLRIFMIQYFGSENRWIYPFYFNTFIILPEPFINYEYENPYTGEHHRLNWESAGAHDILVKTTNREEYVIPCNARPIFKMISISDGSNRYGGTDKLAEWRLTVGVEYEVEIPTYMALQTDWNVDTVKMTLDAASVYSENEIYNTMMSSMNTDQRSEYTSFLVDEFGKRFTSEQALKKMTVETLKKLDNFQGTDQQLKETVIDLKDPNVVKVTSQQLAYKVPQEIEADTKSWETGLDTTSSDINFHIPKSDITKWCEKRSYSFKTRYFHMITKAEEDSDPTFTIASPEKVYFDRLILICRNGPLSYGDHYEVSDDGMEIIIKQEYTRLRKNEMLEMYVYEYSG